MIKAIRRFLYGFVFLSASTSVLANPLCVPDGKLYSGQVKKVLDGDTVILDGNKHLRLIGINAPEVGNKKKRTKDQPLAKTSKKHLSQLLPPKTIVQYQLGADPQDRYRRLLAHVYHKNNNINAQMLRSGMAFLLTVPPNISKIECYKLARNVAQKSKKGIWRHKHYVPVAAKTLKQKTFKGGFIRIKTTITKLRQTNKSVWLEGQGDFRIRISKQDLKSFELSMFKNLVKRQVIVSGYVYWRKGIATLILHHPAHIQVII